MDRFVTEGVNSEMDLGERFSEKVSDSVSEENPLGIQFSSIEMKPEVRNGGFEIPAPVSKIEGKPMHVFGISARGESVRDSGSELAKVSCNLYLRFTLVIGC